MLRISVAVVLASLVASAASAQSAGTDQLKAELANSVILHGMNLDLAGLDTSQTIRINAMVHSDKRDAIKRRRVALIALK